MPSFSWGKEGGGTPPMKKILRVRGASAVLCHHFAAWRCLVPGVTSWRNAGTSTIEPLMIHNFYRPRPLHRTFGDVGKPLLPLGARGVDVCAPNDASCSVSGRMSAYGSLATPYDEARPTMRLQRGLLHPEKGANEQMRGIRNGTERPIDGKGSNHLETCHLSSSSPSTAPVGSSVLWGCRLMKALRGPPTRS